MKKHEEEIPEFLKQLRGEQPFELPPNYFRSMQEEVLDRIRREEEDSVSVSRWELVLGGLRRSWLRPVLALSVCALLISIFVVHSGQQQDELLAFDEEISQEQIEQYLIANLDDFEEASLYQEEISNIDWIRETEGAEESDEIWNELLNDLDETTLQQIL